MVIKPNMSTYTWLLSRRHEANTKQFVEQDLLNNLFRNSWYRLNEAYNLMHAYKLERINPNIIAIHEKMWVLRKQFDQPHYVWNSPKLQIAYNISELLTANATSTQVAPRNVRSYTKPPPGTYKGRRYNIRVKPSPNADNSKRFLIINGQRVDAESE